MRALAYLLKILAIQSFAVALMIIAIWGVQATPQALFDSADFGQRAVAYGVPLLFMATAFVVLFTSLLVETPQRAR